MLYPILLPAVMIRRATPDDAEICGRICYEAFAAINNQHGFPPDLPAPEAGVDLLRMLFSHPGFYCVVRKRAGRSLEAIAWMSVPRLPGWGRLRSHRVYKIRVLDGR